MIKNKLDIRKLILILYITFMLWVIVLKCNADWVVEVAIYNLEQPIETRIFPNIIPFYHLIKFFKSGEWFEIDYFLNVIIYIPFAFYLSYLLKRENKNKIIILISLISSIVFELFQLFSGVGGLDSTDTICNVSGAIFGILLFKFMNQYFSKKFLDYFDIGCLVILIPTFIFTSISTIIFFANLI